MHRAIHRPNPVRAYSSWHGCFPNAGLCASPSTSLTDQAGTDPVYLLQRVLDLALARNPTVASAESTIDQKPRAQVAAYTYLNPSVNANSGCGKMRDLGLFDPAVRESLTGIQSDRGTTDRVAIEMLPANARPKPVWPARRRLGGNPPESCADVKLAFYDLLLAQRDLALAQQNLATIEDVHRAVTTRVRLGESPQFEAIRRSGSPESQTSPSRARQSNAGRPSDARYAHGGSLGPNYAIDGQLHRVGPSFGIEILTERALAEHPTIQRLSKSVEQADHSLEYERQARVPNITVGGSYWRKSAGKPSPAASLFPPVWDRRQGEIITAWAANEKAKRNSSVHAMNSSATSANIFRMQKQQRI